MTDQTKAEHRRSPPARSYYDRSREQFARFMWGTDKPSDARRRTEDEWDDCG